MSKKVIELKLVKSTKGTHVYGDDSEDAMIPSVYVKKHSLPSNPPEKLKVTVEYEV